MVAVCADSRIAGLLRAMVNAYAKAASKMWEFSPRTLGVSPSGPIRVTTGQSAKGSIRFTARLSKWFANRVKVPLQKFMRSSMSTSELATIRQPPSSGGPLTASDEIHSAADLPRVRAARYGAVVYRLPRKCTAGLLITPVGHQAGHGPRTIDRSESQPGEGFDRSCAADGRNNDSGI